MSAVNPLTVFAVCLVWFAAATVILDPAFQLAVIVMIAVLLVALRRIRPLALAALMVPFVLFGIGFVTTHLLFRAEGGRATGSSASAVFASGTVTAALTLGLRAVACGMISLFFAFASDSGGFVRALIAYLRLPAMVGYAIFSAMQTLPALAVEAQQLRMTRAMERGRPIGRIPGPRALAALVVPLLAFAVRRAGRTALAMEARGFAAGRGRTMINVPRFSRADPVFAAAALALLAALLAAAGLSGWP